VELISKNTSLYDMRCCGNKNFKLSISSVWMVQVDRNM